MANSTTRVCRDIEKAKTGIKSALQTIRAASVESTITKINDDLVRIVMCVDNQDERVAMHYATMKMRKDLQKNRANGDSAWSKKENLLAFLMHGITQYKKKIEAGKKGVYDTDDLQQVYTEVTHENLLRHYSNYGSAVFWNEALRHFAEAIAGADLNVMRQENEKKRKREDELWGEDFSDIEEATQTSGASPEAR